MSPNSMLCRERIVDGTRGAASPAEEQTWAKQRLWLIPGAGSTADLWCHSLDVPEA